MTDQKAADASEDARSKPTTNENDADASLHDQIIAVLKTVYDPEIPVDIHELGLIYRVDVLDDGTAEIDMTLTSPNCPAAESLPGEVQAKVLAITGISAVNLEIVWDPTWTPDRMSEAAKLELGLW